MPQVEDVEAERELNVLEDLGVDRLFLFIEEAHKLHREVGWQPVDLGLTATKANEP